MYQVGDSTGYEILVENTSEEDYYFDNNTLKPETEYISGDGSKENPFIAN